MNSKRKLKNYLINPKYQLKYVMWITLTGVILVVMNAAIFYHFTKENYKLLVDMSPMEDEVKVQLYRELNMILVYLGGVSFLFLIVTALLGIVLSHRTAGPMYRFKQVFYQIQQGDINARIRLRPKDDLRDVADECNKAMDALVKKITPL